MHESVRVKGRVETLAEALLHHSYRGLEDFVQRSNRYSTLAAEAWLARPAACGLADLDLRGRSGASSRCTLSAWASSTAGAGFVLAVLYADYVFLRMAKAWEARLPPTGQRH